MAKSGEAREKILKAADALFADRGYAAVSVRDVAREAGVAKAAVFYYFDGKDGLYAAVLDGYYRAHETVLGDALAMEGDLSERMHALIDAYLDFMADNARYARMVQRQIAGGGGDLEVVRANLGVILRGIETALGDVVPADGPLAARHFFVTLAGAVINYFTYAPVLEEGWGSDPLSREGVNERRAHLHWLVDALLAAL
jgi:TetR/AcrR family transcriptional regulator